MDNSSDEEQHGKGKGSTTVTDRIIEKKKDGKMPGYYPGNPQMIKKK